MIDIRPVRDEEIGPWRAAIMETFGADPAQDPLGEERFRALLDPARLFGAFDRGQVVATAGGFDFQLTVPGGSVPMSGLTMVAVRPTHRRRGLLRALIAEHLAAARAHGDAISGLWASEATIYGRFGYGVAVEGDALTFNATGASVRIPRAVDGGTPTADHGDRVEFASEEVAARDMPPVFERAKRPGFFSRTPAWWRYRRVLDRPETRANGTRRFILARRGDTPVGYLLFRQRLTWEGPGQPAGALEIEELVAVDARAEASLWSFVAGVDLFPRVSWPNAPTDCLLPALLDDRRRAQRRRIDSVWLRPCDLTRTLAARTYGDDDALVLGVEGETVALTSDGGVSRCESTDAAPDLVLDRPALGAIYLGTFAPSWLARTGRISGRPEALARADRMFVSSAAAWCPEIF